MGEICTVLVGTFCSTHSAAQNLIRPRYAECKVSVLPSVLSLSDPQMGIFKIKYNKYIGEERVSIKEGHVMPVCMTGSLN